MDNSKRNDQRQYRSIQTQFKITRSENSQDGKYIDGYFSLYGIITELWTGACEVIEPGAFDRAVREDDVRALINHDTTLVLGRTKAETLELRSDNTGLWGRICINENDTEAMNLYYRVERGDVDQCSFGFNIIREETEYPEDGGVIWHIKEVKLYEVSPCTFPQYEETSISARKADYEEIRKRQLSLRKEKSKKRLECIFNAESN